MSEDIKNVLVSNPHISDEELDMWNAGKIADPGDASLIQEHVNSCVKCASRITFLNQLATFPATQPEDLTPEEHEIIEKALGPKPK